MPKISPKDIPFKISDKGFYLDGRLTALVDGSPYDFMGKEIFTTGFFRQNIGFGITNIDIELNTNLHPIITITFKDLYGNVMFGKNQGTNYGNYKVLFNWPPPKFLFTFKGYLGNQVSWLLTLKQTSVTYQQDGSYDIKCEFVPNQWGFFADLPFLFLLAVKGLKKKELNSSEFSEFKSVFDLIKIGRRVEVKTKEVSREFDNLLQQMTLIKSGRIVEALAYSRLIRLGEKIDGTVGKNKIKKSGSLNFNTITINKPSDSRIDSVEKIKAYTSTSAEALRKVNTYLLLNAKIGGISPLGVSLDSINFNGGVYEEVASRQRTSAIDDNIRVIQEAIKSRVYESSKSQLSKITIGEIFKHLARDSGYLIGRILKAGEEGYVNNTDRDSAVESEAIINKYYPLMIKGDKKEEVPAEGYGVDKYEMAFVNQFVTAISEGVAKDLITTTNESGQASTNNVLVKRVNNVEGPKDNPYRPFFRNIAQNVMVRSGIISFLTRSNDPNYPGDYDAFMIDRESVEEVTSLATSDMENISVSMLSEMDEEEAIQLKQFCTFWKNFVSNDGTKILNDNGSVAFDAPKVGFGDNIPSSTLNKGVIVDKSSKTKKTLKEIYTMAFGGVGPKNSIDNSNFKYIDSGSLQAQAIYNNGILYRVPDGTKVKDDFAFVIFTGVDATKVKEVNSSNSDSEARNSNADEGGIFTGLPNLKGYVPIDTYNDNNGTVLGRIEFMNERASVALLKYADMANPGISSWDSESAWMADCVYPTDTVFVNANEPITNYEKQIPATNSAVSVAFHTYTGDKGLVFGIFYETTSGRNHAACIKKMCEIILDKFSKLEEEKNQIVSQVLGKAEEGKNALYKQFNILYHQWESLLYTDASDDKINGSYIKLKTGEIVSALENRFGADSQHKSPTSGNRVASVNSYNNCTFVYDYPLNNTTKLNVKNSIVNIEPMYKPNGNTTVLNIIQQMCAKNNFMFVPIPGNGNFNDCSEVFTPKITTNVELKNLFYVMFSPTPESRTKLDNNDFSSLSQNGEVEITADAMEVQVGSPFNKIFKSIDIETYENKPTAESIVNLQRLTDNENQNKKVTTDCSLLPVMEGRSCKTTFEMVGNAQIYPFQYFYLNSIPLFNGLYQTLKVNHSITPNDMTTKAQGIRMRFSKNTEAGIKPITLESLANLDVDISSLEADKLKSRDVKERLSYTPPFSNPVAVDSGDPNAGSLEQCPPLPNVLPGAIVKSSWVPDAYGHKIQGKAEFVRAVENAYLALKSLGISLSIGDTYRSFEFQKKARESYLVALENYKAGKSWVKNGKTYPASKKPANVAEPCSGYHVRGQAMDIEQSSFNRKDIRNHGPIYQALYNAGLRRISGEWWHWSIGETEHPRDKRFSDDTW